MKSAASEKRKHGHFRTKSTGHPVAEDEIGDFQFLVVGRNDHVSKKKKSGKVGTVTIPIPDTREPSSKGKTKKSKAPKNASASAKMPPKRVRSMDSDDVKDKQDQISVKYEIRASNYTNMPYRMNIYPVTPKKFEETTVIPGIPATVSVVSPDILGIEINQGWKRCMYYGPFLATSIGISVAFHDDVTDSFLSEEDMAAIVADITVTEKGKNGYKKHDRIRSFCHTGEPSELEKKQSDAATGSELTASFTSS